MTEKRFSIKAGSIIGLSSIYTDNGKVMTHLEVLDVLIKQHETIQIFTKENEQLKQSVNNLKDTIIKITIAYQRKYDRTIVDLVDEVHDEDITDLIKEWQRND